MHPGMVLGGRYHLDDLLSDLDGARFWRATDRVLARTVAVHALRSDDPRTPGVLEAARVCATLSEPHLLRVLDVGTDDGLTWVVNEWGSGASLDVLAGEHPLPADRAAWLVREVAEALAVTHALGHAHGRLNPENVMVIETGSVKLIGFGLEAALKDPDLDPEAARHRDVRDLGGLLHCALTGCWAGVTSSQVRPAPTDGQGPLRPRKVRAGVPGALDSICERILGRGGEWPLTTAHEIAAALGTWAGETPPLEPVHLPGRDVEVQPVTLRSTEPAAPMLWADDTVDPEPWDPAPARPSPPPPAEATAAATAAVTPLPDDDEPEWLRGSGTPDVEPTRRVRTDAPETGPEAGQDADPEATQLSPVAGGTAEPGHRASPQEISTGDIDATQQVDRLGDDEPVAPAPPEFEPVPERPLFAPEGARRTPKAHARTTPARIPVEEQAAPPPEPPEDTGWPFGGPREEEAWVAPEPGRSRNWLRWPLLIGAVILVLVGVFTLLDLSGDDPASPQADPTPTAPASSAAPSGPIAVSQVTDLDPGGDPPEENPDLAPLAADGDRATTWRTLTYRGRPDLGGLKEGVGLILDLGEVQQVGRVRIDLVGEGTDLSLFAARPGASTPSDVDGLDEVANATDAGERVVLDLARPARTRYLVLWLTSLPAVSDGFRAEVAEVGVFS